MYLKKCVLWLSTLVFIMAALFGCAASNPNAPYGAGAGVVYTAKLQPGVTFNAARQDLADVLSGRQGSIGIKYYGNPGINDRDRQGELMELLKGGSGYHYFYDRHGSRVELTYVLFKQFSVTEDGIEISHRLSIPFDDLIEGPVTVGKGRQDYKYVVRPGPVSFHFKNLAAAQKCADSLYALQKFQKTVEDERAKRLARFETLALQYRGLTIKPPVSEEQRRYIVQANALNQRKDYAGAIDLYRKAIDLDPVSYPGAYFNLALLSAQLQRYNRAIAYMKQYLLLVPEARDARNAQDKIYEWEIMMQRN